MTALPDESASLGNPEFEAEAKATDRVVVFSDAVIAIAITLLALEIPVPDTEHLSNLAIWQALVAHRDDYLDFVISFLVIGTHWATHRRIFRYVCRLSGHVGKLNMLWLLLMIVTPPATKLLAADGGALGVRFTIYALIQVIATACTMEMSREVRLGGMLRPDAPESARHPDLVPYLATMLVFLVSIPVSYFSAWAFAIWALSPAAGRWLRMLAARRGIVTPYS